MKDENAQQLLAKVMEWEETEIVKEHLPKLQRLASYKYDGYQQFLPGKKFIESLALWLRQFKISDRADALRLVEEKIIFISEYEMSHLVETAYPDYIVQERIRLVSEESGIPSYRIRRIINSERFKSLSLKTLYLGLSDGSRTSELRRASRGEINNEQIWQAYELGPEKTADMTDKLHKSLKTEGFEESKAKFNIVWLLDDFSGSGNTYVRYKPKEQKYAGKIPKIYEQLNKGDLVDTSHYEVYLLLYVASRQAIDHIEYWAERFTSENGYKPLKLKVLHKIEPEHNLLEGRDEDFMRLIASDEYYDKEVEDDHTKIGGTDDVKMGFAGCGLPVILSHNTPNNSLYIFWAYDHLGFKGLFPRVSRHRD